MEIMRNILAITLIGVFSQASMAQNQEVTEALQEIASIVISINHFPSDENKLYWKESLATTTYRRVYVLSQAM